MEQHFYPIHEMEQALLKCLQDLASDEERQMAWNWIAAKEEHRKYYETLRDAWLVSGMNQPMPERQIQNSWQKVYKKIDNPLGQRKHLVSRNYKIARWVVRIAAVFVLVFLTGILYKYVKTQTADDSNEYFTMEAPKGSKTFLTLTDGSGIWLNAGSQIRYSRQFNQHNRDLYLRGEAYFEVAKNRQLPFKVYASGIVVKALGTVFNVKAYPEEKVVEATLVKGRISVENTNDHTGKNEIILEPNQKVAYYKEEDTRLAGTQHSRKTTTLDSIPSTPGRAEITHNVNTEIYTSWKDKRWLFENENLGAFAMKLERLYDISIVFNDPELKQYKLSGTLQEETIEQVLRAIQLTIPIDYHIEHKKVMLSLNQGLKEKYQKLLKK